MRPHVVSKGVGSGTRGVFQHPEKLGGVEGLAFNDDRGVAPLTDRAPRQAHRHHAWAGARAAIAPTIRSASAPTRPIEVERGSTTLIPAK